MIEPDEHTRAAMRRLLRIDEYTWNLKLSLRPRVCNWSGAKLPMFKYAYKGYRIITGPGDDVLIIRWMSQESYLIEKLKGTIE